MEANKNLYAIYVKADEQIIGKLLRRLKGLAKDNDFSMWDDDLIIKDQIWKPEDASRLEKADVFILFLSKNFMYSEFVKQLEFKNIIDRYKDGSANVIPILLDDCPWDADFNAEEYSFSFKELQVLPEGNEPIRNWKSRKEALRKIFDQVKLMVVGAEIEEPIIKEQIVEETLIEEEPIAFDSEREDQLALNFAKEAEAKKLAEEETRKKLEADAVLEAEKEKQRLEKEAKQKKLQEEAEAVRLAKLEKFQQEAEQKRKLEEENYGANSAVEDEEGAAPNQKSKRRILAGLLAAAFIIGAIVTFSGSSEADVETPIMAPKDVEVMAPVEAEKVENIAPEKEETLTLLSIGEIYDGGFVFEISKDGKTGKMAHIDDAGPITWNEAMKIDEQLGDGWRLPTMDELKTMYTTIGQGAENNGEFADEFYWSATPFDENQARLVRFRDGNSSYHYNSRGTHRKFLVRAIRDFSR